MAGYDPKRRPVAADSDEPAPVDALLDPEPTPPAAEPEVQYEVELVDEPGGDTVLHDDTARPAASEHPAESGHPAEIEVLSDEPELAEPEPVVAEVAEPAPEPVVVEAAAAEPEQGERHLRAVPGGTSDVPVAEPPMEPTTNRAVALVGASVAAMLVVLLLLLLRRRNR